MERKAAVAKPVEKKKIRKSLGSKTPLTKQAQKNQPAKRRSGKQRAVVSRPDAHLNDSETVHLVTGVPSLRLKEKAAIYRLWYQQQAPRVLSRLASVSGYVFILFGLGLTLGLLSEASPTARNLLANTACALDACDAIVTPSPDSVSSQTNNVISQPPRVTFSAVPTTVTGEERLILTIQDASSWQAYLVSFETAETMELLNPQDQGNNTWVYQINANNIIPGTYQVVVKAKARDARSEVIFNGPRFSLYQATAVTTATDNTSPTTTAATSEREPVTNAAVPAVERVDTTSSSASNSAPTPTAPFINLTLAAGEQTADRYRLFIETDTPNYRTVELYIQAANALEPQYLGVATKVERGWMYWLSLENVPVGTYFVYAVAKGQDTPLTSSRLRLERKRPLVSAPPTNQPTTVVPVTSTDTIKRVVSVGFDLPADATAAAKSTTTDLIIDREEQIFIRDLLQAEKDTVTDVLERYAVARVSQDETTIRLATEAVENFADELTVVAITNTNVSLAAGDIKRSVLSELTSMRDRIDSFVTLSSNRELEQSTLDSDGDGIADVDEVHLYRTDPFNPDTDGDGINDGVEIMRGFDPLNAEPEAIIKYRSPKEVTFATSQLLGVTSITPLVEYGDNFEPLTTQAVIRGFGLPNSFVTLYIFSTPTVVTVKTADDGSFEYIFTRELEDGAHEVYVAMTDNRGEIVAQSAPFAFIKTAQAFTYADAMAETVPLVTENPVKTINFIYYVVAAMGIVAMGLILLLLGYSLRRDPPLPDQVELVGYDRLA